jgi:large subunit ribosomal protein L30
MAIKLKVTQKKSGIGCPPAQRLTLKGLGLKHPNDSVVLLDTVSIRGMIRKVSHLVEVSAVE